MKSTLADVVCKSLLQHKEDRPQALWQQKEVCILTLLLTAVTLLITT